LRQVGIEDQEGLAWNCERYANDVGVLLPVPSLAVSVWATVGVPEIAGATVLTGAALRIAWAPPTASSATSTPSAGTSALAFEDLRIIVLPL